MRNEGTLESTANRMKEISNRIDSTLLEIECRKDLLVLLKKYSSHRCYKVNVEGFRTYLDFGTNSSMWRPPEDFLHSQAKKADKLEIELDNLKVIRRHKTKLYAWNEECNLYYIFEPKKDNK